MIRLRTASLAALLLLGAVSSASGQRPAPSVRAGVFVVHGASLGVDLDIPLLSGVSAIAVMRGLDSGLQCAGVTGLSPCTADGTSFGAGVRAKSMGRGWGIYVEGFAGGHRYRRADFRSMLGGSAGVIRAVGGRGAVELGYEVRSIGADELETLTYTRAGPTIRTTHGVRLAIGLSLR